ncbi:RNA polymerase sigma factor [Nocardiopsis nanhaiensis]
MTRGNETDVPAVGTVEAVHDAFAQPLYRYAWSLLGGGSPGTDDDPVTDAVHEALVAGVGLDSERADPADRGPWLYALVRAACQRRGFAQTCPYTRLATVPEETPVARMFSRLPASHRELVELNLRHALPASAVSRVLGLDPRICAELSRSAIRRAAEGIEGIPASGPDLPDGPGSSHETRDPGDAEGSGDTGAPGGDPDDPEEEFPGAVWRTQVQRVSSALALLRPPGPPPGLRARVLHTCTAPEAAEARSRIAADMRPLTSDGYPIHRARPLTAPVAEVPAGNGSDDVPLPRALPGDRVTSADHPVHDDARSPLPAPDHDPLDEVTGTERRRWPLPAVSGLATVVVAVGLWWWASAVGGPSTVIDAGPADTGQRPGMSEVEAASTASDGKPGAEPTTASSSGGSVEEEAGRGDAAPEEPSTPQPEAEPTDNESQEGTEEEPEGQPSAAPEPPEPSGPGSPPDHGGGQDPEDDEAPGDGPEGENPDDGSGGLLSGLLGLLTGGG